MKILALNSGSSSIKYRLFDSDKHYQLLKRGLADRIGQKNSSIRHIIGNQPASEREITLPDYPTAMRALFPNNDLEEIDAVGHRVVHGGERFKSPTLIDKEVIKEITKIN